MVGGCAGVEEGSLGVWGRMKIKTIGSMQGFVVTSRCNGWSCEASECASKGGADK